METQSPPTDLVFYKDKHIRYWLRCLKTLLPTDYTTNDSNRMTLSFFILSALDLLGILHDRTTPDERQNYIDWLYHCQHPSGGFRGFPATDLGHLRSEKNAGWDPANLPATYFALAALVVLGDDLSRVRAPACLRWLPKLQRPDGSFGELLGADGQIEGGRDLRFCYCAAGVRYVLQGGREDQRQDEITDIKIDQLVKYIHLSRTYDHGYSEAPYHEAHAGFTYCALGALSLLEQSSPPLTTSSGVALRAVANQSPTLSHPTEIEKTTKGAKMERIFAIHMDVAQNARLMIYTSNPGPVTTMRLSLPVQARQPPMLPVSTADATKMLIPATLSG
ncbi:MAG: Geranylgeranyl transferase type-1 subunit beta [Caeruleum heppii]|nr:MAG: Geranylgeranyl transferase type-1 subunit beta [Caeruleum heppii]